MKNWTLEIAGKVETFESDKALMEQVAAKLHAVMISTGLEEAIIRRGQERYDLHVDLRLEEHSGKH